ncbi:MAG: hypothetical protein R2771_02350 [Saprospiraceae bacterium]
MYKQIGDKLLVKWEPKTLEEWQRSKTIGYTIKIQDITDKSENTIQEITVKPQTKVEIEKLALTKSDFYIHFMITQ